MQGAIKQLASEHANSDTTGPLEGSGKHASERTVLRKSAQVRATLRRFGKERVEGTCATFDVRCWCGADVDAGTAGGIGIQSTYLVDILQNFGCGELEPLKSKKGLSSGGRRSHKN